jgi:AcrR family transcriptional regulator
MAAMVPTLTPRQQEILSASLTVIDRDGIKKFTMKNVANEIGVTDAALYKHFPDKGSILGALADLFKATTLDHLEEIRCTEGLDALGKLERFVKTRAQQFQSNRALTVTLFSDELFRDLASVSSLNSDMMENHGRQLLSIVREGQEAGVLRSDLPAGHIILLLTGPMRLMVAGWKSSPEVGPPLVARVNAYWETFATIVRA